MPDLHLAQTDHVTTDQRNVSCFYDFMTQKNPDVTIIYAQLQFLIHK